MEWFVGIDVSKATLDVSVLSSRGQAASIHLANTPGDHRKLLRRVRKAAGDAPVHWCMEATGPYHWRLALALVQAGEHVSVENPRRVKHFAVAIGAVQKTDRADAKAIARYAQAMRPEAWRLAEPRIRELMFLDRRLSDLARLCTQEANRLEHPCLPELVRQGIQASLKEFERQTQQVEERMAELIEQDPELSESCRLLQTIPGIGTRASVTLLAEAGDVARFQRAEDLAAAFGLHPRLRRSGTSLNGKTRISKAGNAHARCRLYMPAVVGIRVNPILKEFYTKLVLNHKPKKAALIACERKLVMIAYGVLKSRKPFDPDYGRLKN